MTGTKKARLLAGLKKGWITPQMALRDFGIMTLAQRVSEWRRQGYVIVDEWRSVPSGSRFKAYRCVKSPAR